MLIVVFLVIILISLGFIEAFNHYKCRDSVPIRILVNGTRGKTTVSRLIGCALEQSGINTVVKTTGSEAKIIMGDTIIDVPRKRGLNPIRETKYLFKYASKAGAKAVVLECSAIRPEAQVLMGSKLVLPTSVIITNARIDHIDYMGSSKEKTAQVLKLCVPDGMSFYTSDLIYMGDSQAKLVAKGRTGQEQNISLALKVLSDLGIDEETALKGFENFKPDVGLVGPFFVNGKTIINGFAANDMESAQELLKSYNGFTVVYNNRSDREFRLKYFAPLFTDYCQEVIVIGQHVNKVVRYLKKNAIGCMISGFEGSFDSLIDMCNNTVLCMGNIKGKGMEFIQYCQNKEANNASNCS